MFTLYFIAQNHTFLLDKNVKLNIRIKRADFRNLGINIIIMHFSEMDIIYQCEREVIIAINCFVEK